MVNKQKNELTHEVAQEFVKLIERINYENELYNDLSTNTNLSKDEIHLVIKERLDSMVYQLVYSLESSNDYLNKEISVE